MPFPKMSGLEETYTDYKQRWEIEFPCIDSEKEFGKAEESSWDSLACTDHQMNKNVHLLFLGLSKWYVNKTAFKMDHK